MLFISKFLPHSEILSVMAVNFCLPRFSPSISCNKVATDGYDVENLISADEGCRKRGFLAASFISAPVEIVVSFPHSVDISYIVLGLRNGSQRTSTVRLYSDYNSNSDNTSSNYHLISICEDVTHPQLCLVNHCYKSSRLFTSFFPEKPSTLDRRELKSKWISSVCRVQRLKICLSRTANSTVPVLSSLQVWGQPGSDCDAQLKRRIYEIEFDAQKPTKTFSEEKTVAPSEACEEGKNDAENFDIPTDFLDSITHEIMSQPVLLPSGNNVDRLTLEKHIETSAVWGRLPGDPFTGISFNQDNQPTSNIELKTRIDNFLITQGSHLNVPRTTGRHLSVFNSTNKVLNSVPNIHSEKNCSVLFKKGASIAYQKKDKMEKMNNIKSVKRKSNCVSANVKTDSSKEEKESDIFYITRKEISSCTSLGKSSSTEHKEKLASSLRLGLKQVLEGRPSFITNSDNSKRLKTNLNDCIICNSSFPQSVFRLPCLHVLCRSCLLNETRAATICCKTCTISFKSKDAVRVHF